MKSVGEVMAIGRSFNESIQKALRSLEVGFEGFDNVKETSSQKLLSKKNILTELKKPVVDRVLLVAQALRFGKSIREIYNASKIDPWFIGQINQIVKKETEIKRKGLPKSALDFQHIKSMGFSDKKLAQLVSTKSENIF